MTEPRFLIDSNICIYILDDASCPATRAVEARETGEVVTSAIVYAEVMRGLLQDGSSRTRADALFDLIQPFPFDRSAALAYERLPFRRGSFDRLIAAHALSLGLTLVTNNETDYADIPGLRVENWAR